MQLFLVFSRHLKYKRKRRDWFAFCPDQAFARSCFMKYLSLNRIKNEITQANSSPRVTAVSMAIGVALAFSPIPGLHLIVGFILIKVLRLNPILTILGILVHNPWTMAFIHLAGLVTGDLILSGNIASLESFQAFPWKELGFSRFWDAVFWEKNGPLLFAILKPFVVGSILLSGIFGMISYRLTLSLARLAKKRVEGRS